MKRIITMLAIMVMALTGMSQTIQISNMKAKESSFKRLDTNWTIQNLMITPDGDYYHVEWTVFKVRESIYNEIPNDTTFYSVSGNFKKLTKKDGSGYAFELNKDYVMYHLFISEHKIESEKYPERNEHYYIISLNASTYSLYITLTVEEYNALMN